VVKTLLQERYSDINCRHLGSQLATQLSYFKPRTQRVQGQRSSSATALERRGLRYIGIESNIYYGRRLYVDYTPVLINDTTTNNNNSVRIYVAQSKNAGQLAVRLTRPPNLSGMGNE